MLLSYTFHKSYSYKRIYFYRFTAQTFQVTHTHHKIHISPISFRIPTNEHPRTSIPASLVHEAYSEALFRGILLACPNKSRTRDPRGENYSYTHGCCRLNSHTQTTTRRHIVVEAAITTSFCLVCTLAKVASNDNVDCAITVARN